MSKKTEIRGSPEKVTIEELTARLQTKERLSEIFGNAAIVFYERWQASEEKNKVLIEELEKVRAPSSGSE